MKSTNFQIIYQTTSQGLPELFLEETPTKKIAIINSNWALLPYLNLEENLLLGCSGNTQKQLDQLRKLVGQLGLSWVSHEDLASYSPFEQILFQLLRALMQKRQYLIFNHVTKALSISETQQLLMICQKLSTDYPELKIYLVTQNAQLARQA